MIREVPIAELVHPAVKVVDDRTGTFSWTLDLDSPLVKWVDRGKTVALFEFSSKVVFGEGAKPQLDEMMVLVRDGLFVPDSTLVQFYGKPVPYKGLREGQWLMQDQLGIWKVLEGEDDAQGGLAERVKKLESRVAALEAKK